MTFENLTVVWSIRLALLLFALVVSGRWYGFGRHVAAGWGGRVLRMTWLLGCLLVALHVWAVFHWVHHWSHQAASDDTARQTRQALGVSFGGGVYFNYLFLLVWAIDAAWWCGWADRYRRRARLWDALVIGYLWFVAFNATVVFESGVIRWLGLLATFLMVAAGLIRQPATSRAEA